MIELRTVTVFGGERGEGLQKVHKLARFAADLTVVAEDLSAVAGAAEGRGFIEVPSGLSPLVAERLELAEARRFAVHPLAAAGLDEAALEALVAGRSLVVSDLADRALNERISALARRLAVNCVVVDTKDLSNAWFMSLASTDSVLAAVSSRGRAAWVAARTREAVQGLLDETEPWARLMTELRSALAPERRQQGLDRLNDVKKLRRLLARRGHDRALAWALAYLSKEGLL